MKYQVVVPERVQKELKRIENKYRSKIIIALAILENDPFVGKKLDGEHKGEWSYRVWPYRIIYRIESRKLIVLILKIGHRQGIYK